MTVYKWSTTAANNDDIDGSINFQEGQSPASVNNSCRAVMAAIAKFRDDMSGNLVTAGTSTAYTLTTNQVFTALTDGIFVAARMDEVNGAAPTLNVDSLGAKSIATVYGTAVGTGKLRAGGVYVFVYDATDDKWIVQGNPNEGFETGVKILFRMTTPPVGWSKDATYTDAALRVTSGTITQQATGGKEFSNIFKARTIAEANLPSHTHTFSATTSSNGAHTHFAVANDSSTTQMTDPTDYMARQRNSGASADYTFCSDKPGSTPTLAPTSSNGAHTHTVSGTTGATGSGTAMDFAVNFVDVIIATRD